MENREHIVEFTLCKTCVYSDKAEKEDPCWDCLNEPVNEDTRRPVNYKEKK